MQRVTLGCNRHANVPSAKGYIHLLLFLQELAARPVGNVAVENAPPRLSSNRRNCPIIRKIVGATGRKGPAAAVVCKGPKALELGDDFAKIQVVRQRGIAKGCITTCFCVRMRNSAKRNAGRSMNLPR